MTRLILALAVAVLPLSAWGYYSDFSFNLGGGQQCTEQAPILSVSPASIAFGNVSTGTKRVQTLTYSNTGKGTAVVSSVSTTGTGFRNYSSNCGSLVRLATCTTRVEFAPSSAGAASGTTTAVSNLAGKTVALTGTGFASSLYTSYFSNNFGCADSSTVYTCASPNAWTSETDTASQGAISSGAYVVTLAASSTEATIKKTGLTPHNDVEASFTMRLDGSTLVSGSSIRIASVGAASGTAVLVISASGGTAMNRVYVIYSNGTGGVSSTTAANYVWQASTDYAIKFRIKPSSDTSTQNGTYEVTVNGISVTSGTFITYFNTITETTLGLLYTAQPQTRVITYDDFALGYK